MNKRFMTCSLMVAGALFVALQVAPVAAAPISSDFDGRYQGASHLIEGLSKAACSESAIFEVRISRGNIFGRTDDGGKIRGFVTSTGFLTGTYDFGGGDKTAFEGRIDGESLVGGLMKGDGCAWIVRLRKQ